mgnify:CR=1 FL=1
MNQLLTVISQLDQSDLTDRMVRVAIALLNRANDRGELHITRADACAICQVEGADTVAKYLARLAAANVVDWKGGNGAFHLWFAAWSSASDLQPPAAKTKPPAAASTRRVLPIDPPPTTAKWTPWAADQPPAAIWPPPAAVDAPCSTAPSCSW